MLTPETTPGPPTGCATAHDSIKQNTCSPQVTPARPWAAWATEVLTARFPALPFCAMRWPMTSSTLCNTHLVSHDALAERPAVNAFRGMRTGRTTRGVRRGLHACMWCLGRFHTVCAAITCVSA